MDIATENTILLPEEPNYSLPDSTDNEMIILPGQPVLPKADQQNVVVVPKVQVVGDPRELTVLLPGGYLPSDGGGGGGGSTTFLGLTDTPGSYQGFGGYRVSVSGDETKLIFEPVEALTYQNPDPVNVTVGGIEKGDTFFATAKDFAETMHDMFYPTLYPTYVNPSSSFTFNASSLYEVGSSASIDFLAQFNRGSINLDGSFQNYRAGLPNTYHYTGDSLPSSVSSTALSDSRSISITVATGYNTWTSTISYDQGPQPLDSDGNPYDSPYPAGTTSSISRTIEGVYPLFANSADISVMDKQPLVSMITGNNVVIDFPAEAGKKQAFDIPEEWEMSRPLVTVETYNTLSGSWEDTGLGQWDTSSAQHDIQGVTTDYNRYTYNGPDRGSVSIRLKF